MGLQKAKYCTNVLNFDALVVGSKVLAEEDGPVI